MSNANELAPAFPFVEPLVDGGHHVFPGVTKRELAAFMALELASKTSVEVLGRYDDKSIAQRAVMLADALLAQLAK